MSTVNYNGSTPSFNLETPDIQIGNYATLPNTSQNSLFDWFNNSLIKLWDNDYNNQLDLNLKDNIKFTPDDSLRDNILRTDADPNLINLQMKEFKSDNSNLENEMNLQISNNLKNSKNKFNYNGAITAGVNAAALATGNKYIAKGAQIATDVYNAGKDILQNKNLMGAATTALSSALGATGSKFGQAASSIVGNTGNIIEGIKSIKTASTAVSDALKALNAAKAGTDAAKSAQTALNAAKVAKAGSIASLGSTALGVIGDAAFGTPDEYSGKKGNVTAISDMAYDTIMTGMSFVPVWGLLAAAGMAANKFTGQAIKALGGGTDGMTTTDAILGSSFLLATPLGMINGFGGKSTTNWTKDNDVYSKVGNSYNAAQSLANEAEPLAGKKYGLFSSGARKEADAKVREAYRQELILRTIGDDALRDFALQQSMTGVENQKYQNQVNGGYDKTITFSKQGGVLFNNDLFNNRIKRAKIIILKTIIIDNSNDLKDNKFNESIKPKFEIPKEIENKKESKSVIPNGALHARKNNIDCDNITSKGIPVIDNNGEQQAEIERDEIIFRLEITKKLEELLKDNSDKAAIEAGKLLTSEILHNTEDNTGLIDKFKKGGQMNVIPDGALHARLHHMDNSEKLTKKGIPVVDNNGNLQAEIERNEIIFKLEVTKKIEEYYKENTDNSAIKLGKLLTKEILYNTDDKTGLIND